MRPRFSLLFSLAALALAATSLRAATGSAEGQDATVAEAQASATDGAHPLFEKYCFGCHGADEQKGDIRLDRLSADIGHGGDAEGWHAALDVITGGYMPPKKAPQMSDDERRAMVAWIREGLDEAARANEGEARTVLRRLNRAQYTHTLSELLGVRMDHGRPLPGDGKSEMGFTNNGEVLQASPLHIETYEELARRALGHAIVSGPKPQVTRYRVRFGKGIGRGLAAARTGGYQSVPLDTNDFVIDVLDENGEPLVDIPEEEQKALDALRRKISVGLRGSSQDRFRVVDEGLMLYGAKPHKEKAPGAWQGPSPNVKLEMQRVFPEAGDVALRVTASRGYLWRTQQPVLVSLDDPAPYAAVDPESLEVTGAAESLVLTAVSSGDRKNLRNEGDALVPEDVPADSQAKLTVDLPHEGFYQLDLVHPPVPVDRMPSIRARFQKLTLDLRPELSAEQLEGERVVTTIGAAYLPAGRRALFVGGPFFTGFSHLVVTPLPAEHELSRRLDDQIHAREEALAERLPSLRAFAGTRTDDGMDYATFGEPQVVDAPLGAAENYSFYGRLEDLPIPEPESGDTEILSGFLLLGVWNHHLVKDRGDSGPPLLVEAIEVEAPFFPVWPPESHTRIFFESPYAPPSVGGTGEAPDEEFYTYDVLERFMTRAFRRPAEAREVERYMAFWHVARPEFERYEDSVRETLVAILCSPHFLFLVEEPVAGVSDELPLLEGEALATRLAYFLWNSPPDAELLQLAGERRLVAELGAQVGRMLDDPRSERFVRAFVPEWLRLDRLDDMTVDVDRYPDFTRFVKRDMREETLRFFSHVLGEDLDIRTLVDSDFALLNQNLAEFYGVEGVAGPEFRPVAVDPALGRGGLLGQGAFLTGHSDGSEPHPIKRAVWIKEKILGEPPPAPPPNVPELDPKEPRFQGLTLKQQLEVHRDNASCRDCHAGIDPYGVVFEGWDAVGRRVTERGGQPVDDSVALPDGTEVKGMEGLKRYILDEVPDAFAASLIEHLYAYGLGRDVTFADGPALDEIGRYVSSEGGRMRAVLEGIVLSPAFRR